MSGEDAIGSNDYGWSFPELPSRASGQGGDLTQFAIDSDLEVFVREVLQNANDAALEQSEGPVEVTFQLRELTGDRLADFKRAFRWDEWRAQVAAAAAEGNDIAERIDRFADSVEDRDALRTLTIADHNTKGLVGREEAQPGSETTNFEALVRDSLESNKDGDTAGGKFGLGKAVLRIFSGMSTVLFNSVLSRSVPRPESPRLIGRSRLPQHFREDTRHNGQGYFGDLRISDSRFDPAGSIWGPDAASLADALAMPREDGEVSGTNVTVVGFQTPDREGRAPIEDLGEEIREEAVKWFWPAIWNGDLEVDVVAEDQTFDAEIDTVPAIEPFVECFDRESVVSELEDEGDVGIEDVHVDIPDRVEGADGGAQEMPETGVVETSARLTYDEASDLTDHVAFVRGAGMVVRYWDRSKLVHGQRHFHAVALGGLARSWVGNQLADDDQKVEAFLQDAEPPTHNEWAQTDATREDYRRGTKRALDDLKSEIEDTVADLVGPNVERGVRGPELLGNRFPISNDGDSGPDGTQRVGGNLNIYSERDSRRWKFEADVEASDPDMMITEIEIDLPRVGEDRQQNDHVSIESLTHLPDGWAQARDGETVVLRDSSGTTSAEIHGRSEPDDRDTQVNLNVSVTLEPVDGGEE